MKKLFVILLAAAMLCLFASCVHLEDMESSFTTTGSVLIPLEPDCTEPAETTEGESAPVIRVPAVSAVKGFTAHWNEDGLSIDVRMLGFEDGDEVVFFSDRKMTLEVTLTNTGDERISQWLSSYCRELSERHNHELKTSFTDGAGHWLFHDEGDLHPQMLDAWTLLPGESATFLLQLLPRDFEIADASLYTDGYCTFTGSVSFPYYIGEADVNERNTDELSVAVSFDVKNTGAPSAFELDDGRRESISSENEDGLSLSVSTTHAAGWMFGRADGALTLYVTLENKGQQAILQEIPDCAGEHGHELEAWFAGEGGLRMVQEEGFPCVKKSKVWRLEAGEKKSFFLTLLPENFSPEDRSIYDADGLCRFKGEVSFSYFLEGEEKGLPANTKRISLDVNYMLYNSKLSYDVHETTPPETTLPETTETTTEPLMMTEKPVIYLYPEEDTIVCVKLDYKGTLAFTYPAYRDGWTVLARPDGTLQNLADGREYSYLFWDGYDDTEYAFDKGYCVRGEDTALFLQETLAKMGLLPREYNEMIVYWLPRMQNNAYNLITFAGEEYTETAPLAVSPAPDSVLRVFMVWKAIDAPLEIEAPEIVPFERRGFCLVEWGGKEMTE